MLTLPQIEQLFRSALQGAFPHIDQAVEVKPTINPQFGDLSSECCMQVASKLQRPVAQVFAAMLAALPRDFPLQISQENGFLNISLPLNGEACWQTPEKVTPEIGPRYHIIVAPPSETCNGWSQLRLLAVACMQLLLLVGHGQRATLAVADQEMLTSTPGSASSKALWPECARMIRQIVSHPPKVISVSALGNVLKSSLRPEHRNFIWADGPLWEREEYCNGIKGTDLLLRYPDHSWLYPHDLFPQPQVAVDCDDDKLFNLCVYLSGARRATELDIAAVNTVCAENLLPWAELCLARIDRADLHTSADALPPRELLLRFKYIELFFWRAAWNGEVSVAFEALADLLALTTRWTNKPQRGPLSAMNWDPLRSVIALIRVGIC